MIYNREFKNPKSKELLNRIDLSETKGILAELMQVVVYRLSKLQHYEGMNNSFVYIYR